MEKPDQKVCLIAGAAVLSMGLLFQEDFELLQLDLHQTVKQKQG